MIRKTIANCLFSALLALPAVVQSQQPTIPLDSLRLNQIQIIATHNSYHLRPDPSIYRLLRFFYALGLLPADLNPQGIDYAKAPITTQLDQQGVRGLELDIYYDPKGGLYYHRVGMSLCLKRSGSGVDALRKPGFKILHIPDFDFNTTNYTLVSALEEVKRWSDAHPRHLPIYINIECKNDAPGDRIHQVHSLAHALHFDTAAAAAIDAEIKQVFGDKLTGVITPDQVRGSYRSLNDAVTLAGWPSLASCRGKVIFIIDGNSDFYKQGHPSFTGRAMFAYSPPNTPEAAFVIRNDAKQEYREIQYLVKRGYIVRTRSDVEVREVRSGDYSLQRAALNSWAQIISTDYPVPDPRAGTEGYTTYHLAFDGGMARLDSIAYSVYREPVMIRE